MIRNRSRVGGVLAGALLLVGGLSTDGGAGDLVSSAEEVSPILVGTSIPDGPLKARDGTVTTLGGARAGRPAVLVFYRGYW